MLRIVQFPIVQASISKDLLAFFMLARRATNALQIKINVIFSRPEVI